MPNQLIFVRHGVRGNQPLGPPGYLPFFNDKRYLSLYGHINSFDLGKFIRQNYGKPSLIYTDNGTERTISTAIAIAKGAGVNSIEVSQTNPDPFFEMNMGKDEDLKLIKKDILAEKEPEIEKTLELAKRCYPEIQFQKETFFKENGRVDGLLGDLYHLVHYPSFSKLSKIQTVQCDKKLLEEIFNIVNQIIYPDSSLEEMGKVQLGAVNYFLQKQKLTVIVGHDEQNIAILGRFMDKLFSVPGYGKGYIPANSGFVFTLKKNLISIEMIYIKGNGTFSTKKYKDIPIPDYYYEIDDLIKYRV